jgi:hypothetical protein
MSYDYIAEIAYMPMGAVMSSVVQARKAFTGR